MFRRVIALSAALIAAGTLSASAATVDATNNVLVSFDVSSHGDLTFDRSTWRCRDTPLCSTDDELFDQAFDFKVNFGTSAGLSDLGTRTFSSAASGNTDRISGPFVTNPTLFVAGSLDTIFATVLYTGDVFNVGVLNLEVFRTLIVRGTVVGQVPSDPAPVPLPAGLPMLLLGLGGLAVLRRRD